ncbi:MAG TPA: FHA domain-containing protein [Acidimicrobiales bacterium]|nr:FHA domain-containing protein [Acidimicrobiales bacterium]
MTGSGRLEVLGGTGTVWRRDDLVAWFAPGFAPELARRLLELAGDTDPSGGVVGLAGALEGALADSGPAGALAVVREVDGALAVVVQGHVVVSQDGLERLRGAGSDGLVSADLPASVATTLRGAEDHDQMDRPGCLPFDLREGTVPGGGFAFWAAQAAEPIAAPELEDSVVLFDLSAPPARRDPLPVALPAPSPALPPEGAAPPSEVAGTSPDAAPASQSPAPAAEAAGVSEPAPDRVASAPASAGPSPTLPGSGAAPPAAVSAEDVTEVGDAQPAAPAAAGTAAAAVAAAPDHPESEHGHVVRGITCARGHFNNPRALYCGICGLAMVQNSIVLVDGPRPPLGVLLSDAGMAYTLDGDYVLGREPELAPDVIAGRARPIRLDDGTSRISRVHARVSLVDWDVVVTDLKSHNGTNLFNPGETNWQRLQAGQAYVLQPGGRLVVGQSTFEFQSIQRQ